MLAWTLRIEELQRSRALSGAELGEQTMGPAQHAGAVLVMLLALFQRFIALPTRHRYFVVATFVMSRSCWPGTSDIGQPYETLMFAAALLVGELLGYPFELGRRQAFAREASGSGAPAAAAAAVATVATTAPGAMHPLTLRFADTSLECAYSGRAFSESYHVVVTICLGLLVSVIALSALAMLAHPAGSGHATGAAAIAATCIAGLLAVLGGRAALHSAPDQVVARQLFARGWCAMVVLASAWLLVAQHQGHILVRGLLSASQFAFIASLHTLLAVFQRISALPPGPRLLTLLTFALSHTLSEPLSSLGQPHEAALVCSSLLIGELLGHPFELNRRVSFVHESSYLLRRLPSGRIPQPYRRIP